MHLKIPLYFIGVAILANIKPKRDFHAYETRIYMHLKILHSIVIWHMSYIQYIQMMHNAFI